MAEYKGLPLFEAKIDMMDETGVYCISLVDMPATQSDFLAFDEDKKIMTYSIQDEEQRKVFGLVMGCDMPIYRVDKSGYEYFISYSKDTIAKMAEKYMAMGYQNHVDTMHNFKLEDGIVLTQSFIKDESKGVSPKGFEEYNDGSWFAEFHITNDDVWGAIKEGTYKGFSLAGCFIVEEIPMEEKHNKQEKENTIMAKVSKIKEMLRKMLAEFGEVSTDKGVLIYDGNEDLKAGDAVHSIDEEGNDVAVEDGEYRTEDKKIIIVKDGSVEEIKDEEAEVAPIAEEEPIVEEEAKEEEKKEKCEEEEEPKAEEEDEKDARIAELEASIAEKEAKIAELEAKIAELEKEPAAPSAEEAFSKVDAKDDNSAIGKMVKRGYKF